MPAATSCAHRGLLREGMVLPAYDERAGSPPAAGRGHFLIAESAFDHASRLSRETEELRVIQTLSTGVDGLAGRVRPGVPLCDAAGVHDIPVAEWWR